MMERVLTQVLLDWKNDKNHIPLMLRGGRQVGKTYLVEQFAAQHFEHFVKINFEKDKKFYPCFESLDPKHILSEISFIAKQDIVPGKTLLFFDEIQEHIPAIMSLRYFKEECPELHVISAGSLLEFALADEGLRMPVGRVEYLQVYPLSFKEFLQVSGYIQLIDYLEGVSVDTKISTVAHQQLLKLLREYMIVGGMPASVQTYIDSKNYNQCQRRQTGIIDTYHDDFGKYASFAHHKYLQKVFEKTPGLVGQQIIYSKLDPDMRSRELKSAISDLKKAGILRTVLATTGAGLPFVTHANEKKFKLVFLDVGLVNCASHLSADLLLQEDIMLLNRGSVAEQFVGQELLAYSDPFSQSNLFYWSREKLSSKAEVDYLTNVGHTIVPIEVKAGKTGGLKSMHLLMEENKLPLGIKISQRTLGMHGNILELPLYMIHQLGRLVREVLPTRHA